MKRLAAVLLVVGALFAVATVLKRDPSETSGDAAAAAVSPEERDRIRRFWETYRRATDHRVAGETRDAAEEYGRALALDPEHHDALYYLGIMELDLGNFDAAERAWRRLIELEPTSSRAHSQLGTLYFCVGDEPPLQPDRATAELERAVAINREETGPLLGLGEIALVEGDLERARGYFDAVIGSHYTSVEAHFYRGYVAWKTGHPAQAAELLAAAARHARPAAPSGLTSGEGDTRDGTTPMTSAPARCGALRARVDAFAGMDAAAAGRAESVYPGFEELLREVRRRLPA